MSATRLSSAAGFYLWHAGAPLLLAVVLFGVAEYTDLDRRVTDLFYEPGTRSFPLAHAWFLDVVLHQWAKYLLVLLACAVVAAFGLSFVVEVLRPARRRLLFVLLALALGPASVTLLRDPAHKHCPRELEIYGGFAPYQRLLDPTTAGVQPGRCWPSGHAAGGFALFAFYFPWRRRHPRRAAAALGTGLLYGLVLGLGRLMQGALFLSYALSAGVIVWFVVLILYCAILKRDDAAPMTAQTQASWLA